MRLPTLRPYMCVRRTLAVCAVWVWVCGLACVGMACGGPTSDSFKPPANYLSGHVLLVLDTTHWNQALGTALRRQVAAPVPCLPQQEPAFDLFAITPRDFNSTLQRTATLLFVVLYDSHTDANKQLQHLFRSYLPEADAVDSARVHFFRDFYARGQRAAVLLAKDSTAAIALLEKRSAALRRYFEEWEHKYLVDRLREVIDDTLSAGLRARHGFSLQLPKTYTLAVEREDFVWLRYKDALVDKNFFIHRAPYADSSVFSKIPAYREAITRGYLCDSQKPDLCITAQPELPFASQTRDFQGNYAVRTCGLWKLSDHSIGGPFVSYVFADTVGRDLYYIETFLYQPGADKRDLLREMEALLGTFSLSSADRK